MTRTTMLVLIAVLIFAVLFMAGTGIYFTLRYIDLAYTLHVYQQTKHPQIEAIELDRLRRQDELEKDVKELKVLLDIFAEAEVKEFRVTAYAPLDPNAIEGVCYSGDPNVTASGAPPVPYQTTQPVYPVYHHCHTSRVW